MEHVELNMREVFLKDTSLFVFINIYKYKLYLNCI